MTQQNSEWVFIRFLKIAEVPELMTYSGSEFQMVSAATEKARLAKNCLTASDYIIQQRHAYFGHHHIVNFTETDRIEMHLCWAGCPQAV